MTPSSKAGPAHRIYEHRQVGRALTWALGIGAALFSAAIVNQPRGVLGASLIVGAAFLTTALFTSMTVRVTEREMRLWFGPGLIWKTIQIVDIADARAVRNPWWYGWGIHLTPRGWLFNVAGLDAVELELVNRRTLRIGTDEPERLVAAIRQATRKA